MLVADTSMIGPIALYDPAPVNNQETSSGVFGYRNPGKLKFDGKTTGLPGGVFITNFTVVGYRVVTGKLQYSFTPGRILIDGSEYFDDQKRPLPKSFIVFSYVDTKQ
jgi:hypothetical protein